MEDKLFSVENKIAVVTGGLGIIGSQFVYELWNRKAKVVVISRDINDAKIELRFTKDIISSDRIMFLSADISKKESIISAEKNIEDKWGVPNILINNAAIDTTPNAPPEACAPFEQFPEYIFREVMDINVVGTFLCCQVIGGAMAKNGGGSIINISSTYGMVSPVQDIYAYKKEKTGVDFVKPIAYSTSKSAIYNLTRYLATYWAKKNVRVNTLTPSGVEQDSQEEEFKKNYCERIPVGYMACESEYNGAMIFLASDASKYMTGANLVIDGGWTAW